MANLLTATNAMWELVKDRVRPSEYPWESGLQIGSIADWQLTRDRKDLASQYAWTVTAPGTVAFVVEHAGDRVIDPMAGSGWWAHLLGQAGVDVVAYDLHPPGTEENHWHSHGTHVRITVADGATAVAEHGRDRTLLLSWPPYDSPAGTDILSAYAGARVIFIGEGTGGCTGDDRLHELLDAEWTEVASHRPVQWPGLHDYVTVYDRRIGG